MSKNQKGFIFGVGLVTLIGGWVALVYGLLGYFDADSQRVIAAFVLAILWPVSVVASVLITRRLMRGEITAHHHGMDQALDKVAKTAADVATIRTAMHTTIRNVPTAQPSTAARFDDILPKVGTMQIIDAPQGRGEIVD